MDIIHFLQVCQIALNFQPRFSSCPLTCIRVVGGQSRKMAKPIFGRGAGGAVWA